MTTELKPCPFCGGRARLCKHTYEAYGIEGIEPCTSVLYRVSCNQCGTHVADGLWNTDEEYAISSWNERTGCPADTVHCKDCTYLHVLNLEGNYAVCTFHNLMFTASDWEERIAKEFCSWGREEE